MSDAVTPRAWLLKAHNLDAPDSITISLKIVNRYPAEGEEITTYVYGARIPAQPPRGEDARSEWGWDYLFPFTGTGREEGEAFYDVIVTACSDPALVGAEFEFGY